MKKPEKNQRAPEHHQPTFFERILRHTRLAAFLVMGSSVSCGMNCVSQSGNQRPTVARQDENRRWIRIPRDALKAERLPAEAELKEWYFKPENLEERDHLIRQQIGIYIIHMLEKVSYLPESIVFRLFVNKPFTVDVPLMGVNFKVSIVFAKKQAADPLTLYWEVWGGEAEHRFHDRQKLLLPPEELVNPLEEI